MSNVKVTQANQFLRTFAAPLIATDVASTVSEFEDYRDNRTDSYAGQIVYIEGSGELHVITNPGQQDGAGSSPGTSEQIPLGGGSVGGGGVRELANLDDVQIAGGAHQFPDAGGDGVDDYKVVTLNESNKISKDLIEGLNIGSTYTSTADTLSAALNDSSITSVIASGDTLIVDSDNTTGTGAKSYYYTGGGTTDTSNYIPLGSTAGDATSTIAGLVELATIAELDSGDQVGGDGPLAITPPVLRAHIIGTLLNNGVEFTQPSTVPSSASLAVGLTKADADLVVEDSAGYTNLSDLLQNEANSNTATIWWDDSGTKKMYQWAPSDGPVPDDVYDATQSQREDNTNWEMLTYKQNGEWAASTDMSIVDGRFHFGGTGMSQDARLGDVGGAIGGLSNGYTIHHGDRVEDVLKEMLFPPAQPIGWLDTESGSLNVQGAVATKGGWAHYWADTNLSGVTMTVEYKGPKFDANNSELSSINYGGTGTIGSGHPRMQNLNGSSQVTHANSVTSSQSDTGVDFQNTTDTLQISTTSDVINTRSLSVSATFDHDPVTVTYTRLGTTGLQSVRNNGTINKSRSIVGTYPVYYATSSDTTGGWGDSNLTALEYTDNSTPRSATDFAGTDGTWVASGTASSDIQSRTPNNGMRWAPLFRENNKDSYADGGKWHGSVIVYPDALVNNKPTFTVKSGENQTINDQDDRLRILDGTVTIHNVDYKVAIVASASSPGDIDQSTLNRWNVSGISTA